MSLLKTQPDKTVSNSNQEQLIAEDCYENLNDLLVNAENGGYELTDREKRHAAALIIASTFDLTNNRSCHIVDSMCLNLAISKDKIRGYFNNEK